MADYRTGLDKIPHHMHESIGMWIERGEPHPQAMGTFLRALLQNQLLESFAHADLQNRAGMYGWAMFLYNDCPSEARGDMDTLIKWWERRGLQGGTRP